MAKVNPEKLEDAKETVEQRVELGDSGLENALEILEELEENNSLKVGKQWCKLAALQVDSIRQIDSLQIHHSNKDSVIAKVMYQSGSRTRVITEAKMDTCKWEKVERHDVHISEGGSIVVLIKLRNPEDINEYSCDINTSWESGLNTPIFHKR